MFLKKQNLKNKIALVTGAGKGIGKACAIALAEAGASLIIVSRTKKDLDQVSKIIKKFRSKCKSYVCDVTKYSEIKSVIDSQKRIDILVNNAGTNIRKRPEEYSLKEWTSIINTNLVSMFICSKACYEHFIKNKSGKIINIGSMHSLFGAPLGSAYSASKGGVVQLTKSFANTWASKNIQVNAVLPGYIDTELTKQARLDIPGLEKRVAERTPAGRWGDPDDLGGIAVFLASEASNYITGTAIPVDGGYSING